MNKQNQKVTAQMKQLEDYRNFVVERELEAREAEAVYKRYHFIIEADKIREDFEKVMQKNFERQLQMMEDKKKFIEAAQENSESLNVEDALPQGEN